MRHMTMTSVKSKEKRRLRVSENRIPRQISGPKMGENEERRRLHNKEIQIKAQGSPGDVYVRMSLINIIMGLGERSIPIFPIDVSSVQNA